MEIEQLIPESVDWTPKFKDENNDEKEVTFTFRPFNLEDESWLKRTYGEKQLQEIFENLQMEKIVRIAFRQLDTNSKRELMKIKFIDIDEDGNEIEIAAKGPDKLGCFVVGYPDQLELMKKLLRTRGISMPILEALGEKILEEQKKKAATI